MASGNAVTLAGSDRFDHRRPEPTGTAAVAGGTINLAGHRRLGRHRRPARR